MARSPVALFTGWHDVDDAPLQPGLGSGCGLVAKAARWLTGMFDLGRVDADDADRALVARHPDTGRVAVEHVEHEAGAGRDRAVGLARARRGLHLSGDDHRSDQRADDEDD